MRKWYKTGRKQRTRNIRELLRDYVLILANTGMRHGTETANLKWNNIEEFKAKDNKKYLRIWVNGKTGKRELIARHSVSNYLKRIQNRFVFHPLSRQLLRSQTWNQMTVMFLYHPY